ncbi:catalase [Eremomyces bilateralis CBS 781.70]|uniref:Catalase n=1 Tax=Eremomyces bilateralis CBS 781.70 TaxID=1392243 RepID=A0A6G1FRG8_9PEZI|nr:catalase [Eremomyces bilateralis CBS 781.70]KAF1808328.1 catalase [Eremomyces bilateralis CBS 781.70]
MTGELLKSGLEKAEMMVGGEQNAKLAQFKVNTKDVTSGNGVITSDYGVKQVNTDDWLKVVNENHTGPALLEDPFAREKIHRFDHERIPERVVHARGSGAFGTFRLLESAQDVTSAGILTDTSRETPLFIRFSTVLGSRGSADTVRDVRGFAVKFYTQEGNWDIVGNNIPVFFIQDAIKFPDVIHAGKAEPHNEVPQAQTAHNNFWDFQFMHTEATHMFMWTQSDRAIPRSFRMMQGFGVNTYTLINSEGKRHFVKFHFVPEQGVHSLVWDEAQKIGGQDPDFHRKDLWDAIEAGAYPKWRFGIQVIPEANEHEFDFDILDATKIWPEDLVPVRFIGEIELNRNPDEFFPQTEQIAFCTSHVVPGIGFSDDPLLQGRNFSYFDTQLSRLGVNWQELPINRPICPVLNHNRDGQSRHTITKGTVNYWPNRFSAGPPAEKSDPTSYVDYPQKVEGIKVRTKSAKFKEHFNQAQLFYNSLSPPEQAHIQSALSFELSHCDDPTVHERLCQRLADIDLGLAQRVAQTVGSPAPQKSNHPNHGKKTIHLSQTEFPGSNTIPARKIALLIANGFDSTVYQTIEKAYKALGALPTPVGPVRTPIQPASGSAVQPIHHLESARSTLFDAVILIGGNESYQATLSNNGRAVHWVREAFGHCKPVGAIGGAGIAILKTAVGTVQQVQIAQGSSVLESFGVVTAGEQATLGDEMMKQGSFMTTFTQVLAKHRAWNRETEGLTTMVAY